MCPPKLPVILCSRGAPSKPGPNAQTYRQTMTLTSPGTVMLASRLSVSHELTEQLSPILPGVLSGIKVLWGPNLELLRRLLRFYFLD